MRYLKEITGLALMAAGASLVTVMAGSQAARSAHNATTKSVHLLSIGAKGGPDKVLKGSHSASGIAYDYSSSTITVSSTPTPVAQVSLHVRPGDAVIVNAGADMGGLGGGGVLMNCYVSANQGNGPIQIGNPVETSMGGEINLAVVVPPLPGKATRTTISLTCDSGYPAPVWNVNLIAFTHR